MTNDDTFDPDDFIDTSSRALIRDYVQRVDAAILSALDGAEHGVLVTWTDPAPMTPSSIEEGRETLRLEGYLDVRADPSIPFGYVRERRV